MTKKLVYTPGVSAYVSVKTALGYETYDLTDDITTYSIDLLTDKPSTFSITLKNEGGKYHGVFTPMDRIVIYLTKIDTYQVFSGYIRKATLWSLNNKEVTISGSDVLYRLEKLYWDSKLYESQELQRNVSQLWSSTEQYWQNGVSVLTEVANWNPEKIMVGQIPKEVVDMAMELYQARLEDTQGADLVSQVYEMLKSTGTSYLFSTIDGYNGVASAAAVEAAVQWCLAVAADDSHGYSQANRDGNPDYDCSSLMYYALLNNGWTTEELGTYAFTTVSMDRILPACGWTKFVYNKDTSSLKRGDIMWKDGHTEMYIGGAQTVGAHSAENGGIYGKGGDQTGRELSVVDISGGWTHFFRYKDII